VRALNLSVRNFRNLEEVTVSFCPSLNFLLGRNGQGKTNVLEALYLIGNHRSFRQARNSDFCQFNHSLASVTASLEDTIGEQIVQQTFSGNQRAYYLNGNRSKSAIDVIGRFVLVTFIPEDLILIRGGPLERRQFLDKLAVDLKPSYLRVLLAYHQALKNKNEILKRPGATARQLTPWNELMVQYGEIVWKNREEVVSILSSSTEDLYQHIAGDKTKLQLKLLYMGSSHERPSLQEELESRQGEELARKRALVGPHKDDLVIALNGQAARNFASQGQVRSVVLALKLASVEIVRSYRGEYPIVLLDDVDSELDQLRSSQLFELVAQTSAQVFITSTERCSVPRSMLTTNKVFLVTDGTVKDVQTEDNKTLVRNTH
jgi:DNA replication and repair protein RecF